MVGWHDKRRELFFNSLSDNIYVDPDSVDQVLMARDLVTVRDPERADQLVAELRGEPGPNGRINLLGRRTPAEAVQMFPNDLAPEYFLVSQQRVQPGTDPEHGTPLPRPPENSRLGEDVRIAVVDTGIADQPGARDVWNRPDPGGGFDPLYDTRTLEEEEPKLAWAAGHGTFIGSLIRQVAPAAEVIPIKACSPMGFETEDEVARGIDRAVAEGAHIINLSWCSYALACNGEESDYHEPLRLRAAVENAVDNGIVVVAAAGNSASTDPMYPAAWPDVVAVGALDRDGRRWDYSNYGDWVNAWALGEDLRGVYVAGAENPDNDPDGWAEEWDHPEINYATWTGTSFAAPLVAAQIAIVMAATGKAPRDAKDLLLEMSHDFTVVGGGKRIMVDVPGQT
jgi:subtilisin family serine protease